MSKGGTSVPRVKRISLLVLLTAFSIVFLQISLAGASSGPKLLPNLTVKSERNAGYDRDLFNLWIDADSDGCDTRDEVLYRQNRDRGGSCGTSRGVWKSAYDGLRLTNSSDLDIDHFVPLSEAWGSGARKWNAGTRTRYANDLYGYSLLAVSASSNRSKGDSDPSEWLPRASFQCVYAARWIAVKYRWRLSVDRSEKSALSRIMRGCSRGSLRIDKTKRAKRGFKGKGGGGGHKGLDPRFATCSAAKAAGYGPYVEGRDPEYAWYRDADSDGIVCE